MNFHKITDISVSDTDLMDSVYLTLDVDWASDFVLYETLKFLEDAKISATILLTHETDLIQDIRKKSNLELGIHPNFNFLLEGDFRYGKNYEEVIEYYMNIVPDAKVVRSHSVTSNSKILMCFKKFGLEYDLNTEIPFSSNIELKPYEDWTGLIKVPYFWQENISFEYKWELDPKLFLDYKGLKVFNFHPIHIYLNSVSMHTYNDSIQYLNDAVKLKNKINHEQNGIKNFFQDLIKEVNAYGK